MTSEEAALFLLGRMGRWMGDECVDDGRAKTDDELQVEAWLWEQAGQLTMASILRHPTSRATVESDG